MIIVKKIENQKEMDFAFAIRTEVFTKEQGVSMSIERDASDTNAIHVLALLDEVPVGTGRIVFYKDRGKIGRVALLKAYRGLGLGLKICQELLESAREQGIHYVTLHAQIEAKDFYIKMGFVPIGNEFIEAGIRHIEMEKEII